MKKRIISFVILLCVLLGLVSCSRAGGNYRNMGVEYKIYAESAGVVDIHLSAGITVNIPKSIVGIPVVSIRISQRYLTLDFVLVRNLILPETMKYIDVTVYSYCDELQYNEYDNGLYLGTSDNPYFAFIRVKEGEYKNEIEQYSFKPTNDISPDKEMTPTIEWLYNEGSYITSCEIHPDTKIIAESAFANAIYLKSIVIPDGVEYINDYAFAGCESLESITLGKGVKEIGSSAFQQCVSLKDIYIPKNVEHLEGALWLCESLENIKVSENNPFYKSIDGNLYSKDGTVLILYATGKQDEVFKIPKGVVEISRTAFTGTEGIKTIIVPSSVTTVDSEVYMDLVEDLYYCGTEKEWENLRWYGFTRYYKGNIHFNCNYDDFE